MKSVHIPYIGLVLTLPLMMLCTVSCQTSVPETPSAASAITPPTAESLSVETIPMEQVPEKYFHPDRATLSPAEQAYSSNLCYQDASGTIYEFDAESGAYRGFIPPIITTTEGADFIAMEWLEKAADELAAHFIPVESYERTYSYSEATRVHKFYYYRCYQGFRSEDMGCVWFTTAGTVDLVTFYHTGRFETIPLPTDLSVKKLDQEFEKRLNGKVCTEIYDRMLKLKDGSPVVSYDYAVRRDDHIERITMDIEI